MNTTDRTARQLLPEPGSFVVDLSRGEVGEVMGHEGPFLQLRPPRGGWEWDVRPGEVRPATDTERLSAKVQVANARRRCGN